MKDEDKTRGQLLKEIAEMRRQIIQLQKLETLQRRAQEELRNISEGSGDAMRLIDRDFNVLRCNAEMVKLIGEPAEGMIGAKCYDQLSAPFCHTKDCTLRRVLRGKKRIRIETVKETGNGRKITLELVATPLTRGGQVAGVIESFRDITERKRAEERLRLLSSALEQSTEGIAISDLEGNLLFVNNAFATMHGYTPEELAAKHLSSFHTHEQMPAVEAANRQIRETGEFSGEVYHAQRDGTVFPTLMHNSLLRDEAGTPIGMIGTVRNITDRKQAEEALRESEEKYRALFETAKDVIFLSDETGRFVDVNQAACKSLGYSKEELLKLSNREIDADPRGYEAFLKVRNGLLKEITFEVNQRRKDGTLLPVEITGSFFTTGGQRIALAIGRDITERKKFEKKLKDTLKELRQALRGTIQAMALTVETRDPYTAGHQRRTADLARTIAKEMGFPRDKITGIRMAGVLHDIGKIAIPAEILSKPGRLSKAEFGLIKNHPKVGYDILKSIKFPWPVAQIVLQHHERIDGSGYPDGLLGKEIIIEARILGIADVVEAMASHRPYRPALGIDKALEEISNNRGKLYDAEAADACLRVFKDKGFKFK